MQLLTQAVPQVGAIAWKFISSSVADTKASCRNRRRLAPIIPPISALNPRTCSHGSNTLDFTAVSTTIEHAGQHGEIIRYRAVLPKQAGT
jgi:hypothetical protein